MPRLAPFTIWNDPVGELDWSAGERARFASHASMRWLLEPFPGGLHVRPIGDERDVLLIWTFESAPHEYVWPPAIDPNLGDVLLRGFAHMAPSAAAYIGEGHRGYMTGSTLPSYATALSPRRYADVDYRRRLEGWDAKAGQL